MSDENNRETYAKLQDIGRDCASCLAEMVAALNCDYDRLEYLKDNVSGPDETEELTELQAAAGDCESRDDAEQRIQEDPLSIELSGTWVLGETPVADRALILLGTGGPATRIVCELDDDREPRRAWVEAQDWGTAWTEYTGDVISQDDLLTYCRCFYFGE